MKTDVEVGTARRAGGRIAVLGGGTGLSTIVSGITSELCFGERATAIVSTFDSGGGTGLLRQVYPELPAVGDLRRNFAAMGKLAPEVLQVLERRYAPGVDATGLNVAGQTPGNLLIASALQLVGEQGGTFDDALELIGSIYQTKGRVVAVSNDVRTLRYELVDGRIVHGESTMEDDPVERLEGVEIGFDEGPAHIGEAARSAVASADMVVLAPGDQYTSIGPTLCVHGMKELLAEAPLVVMIANLMNRNRHTLGYDVLTYAREYERLLGGRFISQIIVNSGKLDARALSEQARLYGSHPVQTNVDDLKRAGYAVYEADLLSHDSVPVDPHDALGQTRSMILHDASKAASALRAVYDRYVAGLL